MPQFLITSPDGKKYRVTAPDGASQDDVLKFVQNQHQAPKVAVTPPTEEVYNPAEGGTNKYFDLGSMSIKERPNNALDRMVEGIGSGMVRYGRGAGNLLAKALGMADKESSVSNQALREQQETDAPLGADTAGRIGQGIGQVAASLPLSLGYGAASNAARGVPLLGRALGSPYTRAAVEGAANAAATADEGSQGKAALLGAGTGVGLTGILQGAGRAIRGLAQKSQATSDLEHLAEQQGKDLFIPVAQAADERGDLLTRGIKSVYKEGLPLIPGVSGQVKGQANAAERVIRDIALEEATPEGASIATAENPLEARRMLRDSFNNAYNQTVKSYSFNVPQDFRQRVADRIRASMPNVDDTTLNNIVNRVGEHMDRFSSGQPVIAGENLLNAKNATSAMVSGLRGPEKVAASHAAGVFDDLIHSELTQGNAPGNIADLTRYEQLSQPYSALKQVGRAINAAKTSGGEFTPKQLAAAARDPGTLSHLGITANRVLGQPVAQPSTAGRVAAYSLGALGGYHNPLMLGGAVGGANLLATKTVQRAVMGDTAAQRAIQELIENHPDARAAVEFMLKSAASTQAGQNASQ